VTIRPIDPQTLQPHEAAVDRELRRHVFRAGAQVFELRPGSRPVVSIVDPGEPETAIDAADRMRRAYMGDPERIRAAVAMASVPRRDFVPQGCDAQGRLEPTIPAPAADSAEGCAGDDMRAVSPAIRWNAALVERVRRLSDVERFVLVVFAALAAAALLALLGVAWPGPIGGGSVGLEVITLGSWT
jgi:hypothetical protein